VCSSDLGDEKVPPQFQKQMQELSAQHEELTNQLNQAKELLSGKQMEIESRERIAKMQTDAQLAIALAQVQSSAGIAEMKAQLQAITTQQKFDHEKDLADRDHVASHIGGELDREQERALADQAARTEQNAAILAAIATAPPASAPTQGASGVPSPQPTTPTSAPALTPRGVPPGA
jgi:hypothetical protein